MVEEPDEKIGKGQHEKCKKSRREKVPGLEGKGVTRKKRPKIEWEWATHYRTIRGGRIPRVKKKKSPGLAEDGPLKNPTTGLQKRGFYLRRAGPNWKKREMGYVKKWSRRGGMKKRARSAVRPPGCGLLKTEVEARCWELGVPLRKKTRTPWEKCTDE